MIYFLADASSHKDDAIRHYLSVNVALQDGSSYISVSGQASVSHNAPKIRELWTPVAQAWRDRP